MTFCVVQNIVTSVRSQRANFTTAEGDTIASHTEAGDQTLIWSLSSSTIIPPTMHPIFWVLWNWRLLLHHVEGSILIPRLFLPHSGCPRQQLSDINGLRSVEPVWQIHKHGMCSLMSRYVRKLSEVALCMIPRRWIAFPISSHGLGEWKRSTLLDSCTT